MEDLPADLPDIGEGGGDQNRLPLMDAIGLLPTHARILVLSSLERTQFSIMPNISATHPSPQVKLDDLGKGGKATDHMHLPH